MKFLVLIWPVFLMFSITSEPIADTNSTSELWYTFINSTNLAKPGCNSRCGDLIVPYPFGIGNNSKCYINEGFRIYCNTSLNPPKATISELSNRSIKLISDSTIRRSNRLARMCSSPNSTIYNYTSYRSGSFTDGPYSLSKVNKFTVIGCNSYGVLFTATSVTKVNKSVATGCMVYCSRPEDVVADECTGSGCCQSSIHHGITYYGTGVFNTSGDMLFSDRQSEFPCAYAFIGEENAFKFKGLIDLRDTNFRERIEATVPVVFEWAIGNQSCSEAKATDGYACQSNSKCVSSTRESSGYRCECKEGYEGNPYLPPGCQDINECNRTKDFPCYGTCINTPGNYTCNCKKGYSGDGKIQNDCRPKSFNVLGLSIGIY